ncbi:MAG: hypothetical protein J6W74_02005 [Bacteroidales bacterium]|nr:hypothetical protein [Bacteroidales bacterium]
MKKTYFTPECEKDIVRLEHPVMSTAGAKGGDNNGDFDIVYADDDLWG